MLHAPTPSNDKYPYDNRTRTLTSQPRTQEGRTVSAPTVPTASRLCATGIPFLNNPFHRSIACGVWPILTTLLTAIYYIVSVHKGLQIVYRTATLINSKHSHQRGLSQADYCKSKVSKNLRTRLALQVYWAKPLVIPPLFMTIDPLPLRLGSMSSLRGRS
jgi:hypothetical protein